jgi:hypothetical protein
MTSTYDEYEFRIENYEDSKGEDVDEGECEDEDEDECEDEDESAGTRANTRTTTMRKDNEGEICQLLQEGPKRRGCGDE